MGCRGSSCNMGCALCIQNLLDLFVCYLSHLCMVGEKPYGCDHITLSPYRAACASWNTTTSTINITMATDTCILGVHQRIAVLGGVTGAAVALSFARIVLISWILVNAGRVLHDRMLTSMMRVPMHFYDTNPSGMATPTSVHV